MMPRRCLAAAAADHNQIAGDDCGRVVAVDTAWIIFLRNAPDFPLNFAGSRIDRDHLCIQSPKKEGSVCIGKSATGIRTACRRPFPAPGRLTGYRIDAEIHFMLVTPLAHAGAYVECLHDAVGRGHIKNAIDYQRAGRQRDAHLP